MRESTDITNPVEYTVDVAVDTVQVQVKFPRNLHVDLVGKFIRPYQLVLITVNPSVILRQCTKLVQGILQAKIGQLNLVNVFFTDLRVYRYVFEAGFFGYFAVGVLTRAESLHILVDDDKFSS